MTVYGRGLTPELMALRVARELRDGMVVNLGIGLPILVAEFVPADIDVLLHAEHGLIGFGASAEEGDPYYDPDSVVFGDAKALLPGASIVDHAESFAMVRGGRLDLTVLGGFQVSEQGDLANWRMPRMAAGAVGGAPDIAVHARRVIVMMDHVTRDGSPRLLRECVYPLTARRCVSLVVTNCGVFQPSADGFVLCEIADGVSVEEIREATAARLIVPEAVPRVAL
jgi:3-oxoacid CoA-transferase B subunit